MQGLTITYPEGVEQASRDRLERAIRGGPEALVKFLLDLPNQQTRGAVSRLLLQTLQDQLTRSMVDIADVVDFFEADGTWRQEGDRRTITEAYPVVAAVRQGAAKRDRARTERFKLMIHYGTEFMDKPSIRTIKDPTAMRNLRLIAERNVGTRELTERLNGAISNRNNLRTRGSNRAPVLTPKDIETVFNDVFSNDYNRGLRLAPNDQLDKMMKKRDKAGYVGSDGFITDGTTKTPQMNFVAPKVSSPLPRTNSGSLLLDKTPATVRSALSSSRSPEPHASIGSLSLKAVPDRIFENQFIQQGSQSPSRSSPLSSIDTALIRSPSDTNIHAVLYGNRTQHRRISSTGSIYAPSTPVRESTTEAALVVKSCGCQVNLLGRRLYLKFVSLEKKVSEEDQLAMLQDFIHAIPTRQSNPACSFHFRYLAGTVIGLNIKKKSDIQLLSMIGDMRRHAVDMRRWKAYKQSEQGYSLFRRDHRAPVMSDALGAYRIFYEPPSAFYITQRMAEQFMKAVGLDWKIVSSFRDRGTVNAPLFKWWEKAGLRDLACAEFDMYSYHLRKINNRDNYGWQRAMYHGVCQQLVRQDPAYLLLYATLREDHEYKLISYPYYTKDALPGDNTAFSHIDLNITDMFKQSRLRNILQGTLSLDNEDRKDCTRIIPGLHKHYEEWYQMLLDKGHLAQGNVEKIHPYHWTSEMRHRFRTDWESVPCKALEVRISRPDLPHGSLGPCVSRRRTIFPWYTAVDVGGFLESNLKAGTFEEISRAHRELTMAPTTPSGHSANYGRIPYRFPPAVPLRGLGPISDALIAQRRWTDPEVRYELVRWFGNDGKNLKHHIEEWRSNATKTAKEAWALCKLLEEAAFKDSYMQYYKAHGGKVVPAEIRELTPDFERPPPDGQEDDTDSDQSLYEEPTEDNERTRAYTRSVSKAERADAHKKKSRK